ncbi:restriction endonuclease subunit S [Rhodanobacter sp. MP1X3]|uniref:restriction endonuclease subunit S n=1 Tax=Rhodanobacter sp. MP1X3 TaxID=2723086 RepID=UPI0017DF62CC|nr:restriction endonuclease subunit S [Rhodanobacter sp. MP1X3]MBB6244250.1 type I restriction enzyme S subunit [Rhodanobacter sp. MP1X3]
MAKQGISTAVPRLRFPEFRKAAGWKETSLSSVLVEHGEKNDGASEVHSVSVHKGVVNQIEHLGRSFAAADRSNYSLVKPHDIIYTRSPTGEFPYGIVKQSRLPFNVIVSPLYGVFSPVSRYLGYVLDAYFESPIRTNNYLAPIIQKGAKNTVQISNAIFLSKGLYLPSEEAEQKKIADCLMSLDEVIAAQGRKVEALKAHKRGLMQLLFPREGETRPRLRFPEFRNAPEWEQKAGGVLFENRKEGGEEGLSIYSVTVNDGMIPRASFDRDFYDIEDPVKNKKVYKGDVAYNMMRMWQGAQGVAVEDCMVSPAYVVLSPLEGACSSFFAYLFKLPQSLELLTAYSRGLTKDRLRLYFDDFARMPLCVPGHEEQQRIAECLSSLDTRMTTESNQLTALKTHKQGLMQQLFPAPEAASA